MDRTPWSKVIEEITPELATEYLKLNGRNARNMAPATVRRWAAIMAAGQWFHEHSSGIKFGWDGYLGDGQHRLAAVVLSGMTIRMWVERGVDPAEFVFTDIGKTRTSGDRFRSAGGRADVSHKDVTAVAKAMLDGLFHYNGAIESFRVALDHEDTISRFVDVFKSVAPKTAVVTAAFCNASFEFDKPSLIEAAQRYAGRRFGPRGDPLEALYRRVLDAAKGSNRSGSSRWELYGYAVSAIRAEMEKRTLMNLVRASGDFDGTDAMRGISHNDRVKSSKAALTREKKRKEYIDSLGAENGQRVSAQETKPRFGTQGPDEHEIKRLATEQRAKRKK